MNMPASVKCERAQQSHGSSAPQLYWFTEQYLPVLGEMILEPKPVLTVVVMATAPPRLSTTARCEVPWSSGGTLEF